MIRSRMEGSSCCATRTGRSGTRRRSTAGRRSWTARWRSGAGGRMSCKRASGTRLARDAPPDWPQLPALYGELARRTGSPVVELNQAVAIAESGNVDAALDLVDGLELGRYHYLHPPRAD